MSFPGTGAWTTWQTRTLPVTLVAGANTVRATATTVNGGPNVDYLEVQQ
jgi:hexosaminidase